MKESATEATLSVRLFAAARELEKRHKSNLAKYYAGLAFAETVKQAAAVTLPSVNAEFHQYIGQLNSELEKFGTQGEISSLLEAGRTQLSQAGDLEMRNFPPVYVSMKTGETALDERFESEWIAFARSPLLRPVPPDVAIELLTTGPEKIGSVFEGISEDDFTSTVPSDEWSIQTVLEHLILGETLLHDRVLLILTEDNPVLEYLPVDLTDERYGNSPELVLRRYADDRQATLRTLEGVPQADWYLRSGYHTIYGQITLQEHVSFFARYERENIRRIERIYQALIAGDTKR